MTDLTQKAADQLTATALLAIVNNPGLLEIGRKAIEDVLIEMRDARISEPFRGNGFVVREKDRSPSDIIRFGPEHGLRIALVAIAEHLRRER